MNSIEKIAHGIIAFVAIMVFMLVLDIIDLINWIRSAVSDAEADP